MRTRQSDDKVAEPASPEQETVGAVFLSLSGIGKVYGGTRALDAVNLTIREGSIHAILGENGAGKSTLIKIISGVVQPTTGTITTRSGPATFSGPKAASAAGIGCVFQELSLIPDLSASDNIFIGQGKGRLGLINRRQQTRSAAALLKELGCRAHPSAVVRTLSLADAQLIEIAKALAQKPRLLILDEATSALGEKQVERLFAIMRKLRSEGVAILYISHRMHEIEAICDICSVFRNGSHVATFSQGSRSPGQVVELMLGRSVTQIYPARRKAVDSPPLLEVRGLSWTDRVRNVSFSVRRGEIYGIGGLDGHGQNETLLALFGVLRQTTGSVTIDGKPVVIRSPRQAKGRQVGIALVPEDRKADGLHQALPITSNISLSALDGLTRFGFINHRRERALVSELMRTLQIKAASPDAPVNSLSGGNQQKVVLAKWLACKPQLMLLCDPTRGIDVGTKAEIYVLLRRLAEEGVAIILHSTDYDELVGLCDRVGIFYGGGIVKELDGSEITEQNILRASFGLVDAHSEAEPS
jgi:ribose transport system ATP-binding protein